MTYQQEHIEIEFKIRTEQAAKLLGWIKRWQGIRDNFADLAVREPQYAETFRSKVRLVNRFLADLEKLERINMRGMPADIKDFLWARAERFEREGRSWYGGFKRKVI